MSVSQTISKEAKELIKEVIKKYDITNQPLGFWIFDIQGVLNAFDRWKKALPSVRPCFAIKCNPEPHFVKLLMNLGCGFDCASLNEIEEVINLGCKPEDITFSQSFKPVGQLLKAYELGVRHTIVDSLEEIQKVAKYAPEMGVMVRIKENDTSALHVFGDKFGIEDNEIEIILDEIKKCNLTLNGFHFHVGSESQNNKIFVFALQKTKRFFDLAIQKGFSPYLIDIGGGFSQVTPFEEFGKTIEETIKELQFPEYCHFVSEPGRYFASNAFHLTSPIHGKRERIIGGVKKVDYVMGDGVHGNFTNCIWFDREKKGFCITKPEEGIEMFDSIIYGSSCNGSDYVSKQKLPLLQPGEDWLVFPNHGAYTISMATNFNGFNMKSHEMYVLPSETIKEVVLPSTIQNRHQLPALQ